MTPVQKRKLIVRGGIVVLALAALVIAPGWSALRPAFMERYPAFETSYATWAESEHAKVSCQACHIAPDAVAQGSYAARMLGEFYISIASPGREPELFPTPPDEACLSCHNDLRTISPEGDLNIPHRAHVSALKMRCVDCHDRVVHTAGERADNRPSMAGCLTCHDGTTAKADCSACHTDKDRPKTHDARTWLVSHGTQPREQCTSCHDWTDDWCGDCHAKRPASHVRRWRAVHGDQASKRANCGSCHDDSFCVRCHGEVPEIDGTPLVKVSR